MMNKLISLKKEIDVNKPTFPINNLCWFVCPGSQLVTMIVPRLYSLNTVPDGFPFCFLRYPRESGLCSYLDSLNDAPASYKIRKPSTYTPKYSHQITFLMHI